MQYTDHPPADNELAAASSFSEIICEMLVREGKLSREDADRALRLQQEHDNEEQISALLVKLGFVSERDSADAVSRQLKIPLADKSGFPDELLPADESISLKFLQENKVLILADEEDHLAVAMVDPLDSYVLDALKLITHKTVVPWVGIPSEISQALEQHSAREKEQEEAAGGLQDALYQDDVARLKELASEAPVIKLVNQLMQRAVEQGASDIHVEPFENRLVVRFRVDGILRQIDTPPANIAAAIVSRIKIMANLNIAERRLPQDGRFKIRVKGRAIDLRVSTVPTMFGESVVMRLLHRDEVALDLAYLGFDQEKEQLLLRLLDKPHGIILVTGPTGSGKTTTLYAALKYLNRPEKKILTVEDPVEYNIQGINQIQTKSQIGLTFANALRSIVRQDPDIIMIGEMRDKETAKIAVQSALTGHLVLSTIHTNDAVGSVTRLLDMDVEDYLLTSTVEAVVAQRLIRTLCESCKSPYDPDPELVRRWRLDRWGGTGQSLQLYHPEGCEACGGTGYSGRSAILEILVMDDALRSLVLSHADTGEMAKRAVAGGFQTMFEDGLKKVLAGVTSLEEILRVTQES